MRFKISLIESLILADAVHALGAERKGYKCGQVADFTSFSFHGVITPTPNGGKASNRKGFLCVTPR